MLLADFINVGYGDAILIRETDTPFTMLVDCGDVRIGCSRPDGCRIAAADYLRQEGIRELDLLVLTHLHLDHAGGLAQLLPEVRVREFWANYLPPEEAWGCPLPVPADWPAGARCLMTSMGIYLKALAHLREQGTKIRLIRESCDCCQLTETLTTGIFLENEDLQKRQAAIWGAVFSNSATGADLDCLDGFINNTSIRLRLSYAGQEMELPGDVYASCWEQHQLPPCTIVKLPHHGHGDALTAHLLEMLRPTYAVISVSDNRTDDCPSQKILRLLSQAGTQCFFTDAVQSPPAEAEPHQAIRFEIEKNRPLQVKCLKGGKPLIK